MAIPKEQGQGPDMYKTINCPSSIYHEIEGDCSTSEHLGLF